MIFCTKPHEMLENMIQRRALEAEFKEFVGMADRFLILPPVVQDNRKGKKSFILMKDGI